LLANRDQSVSEDFLMLSDPSGENFSKRDGVQKVPPLSPLAANDQEAGPLKHGKMLHHGKTRQPGKAGGKLAGSAFPARDQIEHFSPRRIRQCSPDAI
jgi:hypothetical protein